MNGIYPPIHYNSRVEQCGGEMGSSLLLTFNLVFLLRFITWYQATGYSILSGRVIDTHVCSILSKGIKSRLDLIPFVGRTGCSGARGFLDVPYDSKVMAFILVNAPKSISR